jgi:hypothetical protein
MVEEGHEEGVYHGVYALMFVDRLVSRNFLDDMNDEEPGGPRPASHGVLPAMKVRSESASHAASRAGGSQHMRDTL